MHPATIGPFQIQRELGRGGMGEVFLALDPKLDRQVAIKALPAHLASDADRLARFQREAKVLASLNHPGIGAIYGFEEAGGHHYLILEFIDGETLADRLAGGAIPIAEALTIARQIAEALEAAHEKGVIHRDLKPANVMVTAEGAAKVLDFGLARTEEPTSSTSALQALPDSPTVASPARPHSPTIPGVIMGTAGYMSPEQARGKAVDKRSDIFSFGCVLFEMLTGARPFRGETVADALGATLHKELDFGLLPPATPPRARELLASCLAKDRRNRLHDIGDARLELERAIAGREWASAPGPAVGRAGPLRTVLTAVGALALVGAGWALARLMTRPAPTAPPQALHVSTTVPAKPEFGAISGIAPDGTFLLCQVRPELSPDSIKPEGLLMVRRLDRDDSSMIEGTEGAAYGSLSPDGRWVVFVAAKDRAGSRYSLKKIALAAGRPNGSPELLCELPKRPADVCWVSDELIAIAAFWESTILTVPAAGGEPSVAFRDQTSAGIEDWGEIRRLGDGKSILAGRWSLVGQTAKERVELIDLTTGKRSVVLDNAASAQFAPGTGTAPGCLLAIRNQNSLIAAPFDLRTLQVTGTPVTVWSGPALANYRLSPGGLLALALRPADVSGRRLAMIDDQAHAQPLQGSPRPFGNIRISPDGTRVLSTFDQSGGNELPAEFWIHDLARRSVSRFPTQGAPIDVGLWSNDGQRITYGVINATEAAIWERRSDGSGEATKLYAAPNNRTLLIAKAWSPDGKVLAFTQVDLAEGAADVLLLEQDAASGAWTARPYLHSKVDEDQLAFSPDGKWVSFVSSESGRPELCVQRFTGAASGDQDAKNGRFQISTNGSGWDYWWSPDGKEIRYRDFESQVMSVQIKTEPTFSASLPKALFSLKAIQSRSLAFTADGRIMAVLRGENEQITKVDLIVNFLDELRSKMATPR